MAKPTDTEVTGVPDVGGQARDVGVEGVEVQAVDPLDRVVQDDEPPAQRVHRVSEHLTGPAVPRDQHERLAQSGHLPGEPLLASASRKARSWSSASSEPMA